MDGSNHWKRRPSLKAKCLGGLAILAGLFSNTPSMITGGFILLSAGFIMSAIEDAPNRGRH